MKKILSCLFAILMLFSLCVPVFASDGELASSSKDMSSSTIEYDFEHVFVKKFNVGQFYENKLKGQPELITMAETGYKQGDKTDFKLFFYVYNPTRLEIQKDSELNTIQLCSNLYSSSSGGYDYKKHNIKLIDTYANSLNSDTHTNALILKYEISDYSSFNMNFAEETERFYLVSSIELHLKNEVNASDFTIGNEYYYSTINGWTSYYSKELDVLRFEKDALEFSYYRVPTENPDVFKDIQSVIVPIPNSYLNKYDDISQVSAVWEECFMKPALIVNDSDIANAFKEFLNQEDVSALDYTFAYGWDGLFDSLDDDYYIKCLTFPSRTVFYKKFDFLFNSFVDITGNRVGYNEFVHEKIAYKNSIDKLLYVYYSKDVFNSDKVCVSSEELMNDLDNYSWSDDVFESIDKTHYDLDNPEVLNVTHLNSQDVYRVAKWYELFKQMVKLDTKVYSDIQKVDPDDLKYKFSGADKFAEKYFVSETDYEDIYNLQNKYEDCTLYVFHYTVTDYITNRAYVYNSESDAPLCDAIVAQGTAIRNFDFIDIHFDTGDSAVVIPVSSDPQNYISDYTGNSSYPPPGENAFNEIIKLLQTVLAIVVVIMILTLILRIYSMFRVQKVKVKEPKNKRR